MRFMNLCRSFICLGLIFVLGAFVLHDQIDEMYQTYKKPLLITAGGEGTKNKPFLIETPEQFASFRDAVNSGESFEGVYFLQTEDIDLKAYSPWTPIGEFGTKCAFVGYYDGDGHVISNLYCDGKKEGLTSANIGLFGYLGGTVANLGIVSGEIKNAACAGSIASHSYPAKNPACIINCFSLIDVQAKVRAGGIADNFSHGYIANCWYVGNTDATYMAGISSYNALGIYNCLSNNKLVEDTYKGFLLQSQQYAKEYLNSKNFIQEINELQNDSEVFFELERDTCVDWDFSLF